MSPNVQRVIRKHVEVWQADEWAHPAPTATALAEAIEAMEISRRELAAVAAVSDSVIGTAADRARDRESSGPIGERAVAMRCYLMDVVEELECRDGEWHWPAEKRDAYFREWIR